MEQPLIRKLAEVEAEHIRAVFEQCGGNMSATAKALGIDRRTMYRRAEQLKLRSWMRQGRPRTVAEARALVAQLEAEQGA
jgi:DNA-binding NtrC family response regulator